MKKVLVIGISGVTCGGKTTSATYLNNILPNSKIFSQDDYFLDVDDPRHVWIPKLKHINFDILSSLDMNKMHTDIQEYIEKQGTRIICNGKQKNFSSLNKISDLECVLSMIKDNNLRIVIVEGFCIFNYKPMQDIFDLKYYFTLDREECLRRRLLRVYEPPDCPGYFEYCVWPEHLKQRDEVREKINEIIFFDEKNSSAEVIEKILSDLKDKIMKEY